MISFQAEFVVLNFDEPNFLFGFFPLAVILFVLILTELRLVFLLCVSLAFYAGGGLANLGFLCCSILANYTLSLLLARKKSPGSSRVLLTFQVLANLAAWFYFRLQDDGVPLGISFFTLQLLGYVWDVNRGKVKAETNLLKFALFVAFFPQLLAGPIMRYSELVEQFCRLRPSIEDFANGSRRFICGLGKKAILVDSLGYRTGLIFDLPAEQLSAPVVVLGALAFVLQLYLDFSAYTDMALGIGLMFGIRLRENFQYPLVATSLQDFWRRWHITLTDWFRDYVYFPRHNEGRNFFKILAVFLLVGVWHGLAWNFVLFGLWHGLMVASESTGLFKPSKLSRLLRHAYVWSVLGLGALLFRAEGIEHSIALLEALGNFGEVDFPLLLFLDLEFFLAILVSFVVSTPINMILVRRLTKSSFDVVQFCFLLFVVSFSLVKLAVGSSESFLYLNF